MCVDSLDTSVVVSNWSLSQLNESAGKTVFRAHEVLTGSRRGTSPSLIHWFILNEGAFRYAASRRCDSAVRYRDMLGHTRATTLCHPFLAPPCGLALDGFLRSQFAVALAAFQQVPAHGVPRLLWRVGADRLEDRIVLFFDAGQILPRAFGVALKRADALPRNDQAAEKIQEFDKAAVLRGDGNRLMEREIFLDG